MVNMVCRDCGKPVLSIHFNASVYTFAWQLSIAQNMQSASWGSFGIGIERVDYFLCLVKCSPTVRKFDICPRGMVTGVVRNFLFLPISQFTSPYDPLVERL